MACNCDKAPEFPTPAFIPGPIEIPINYRAVTIPADQGDDTTNPPLNGAYRNVVLKYAANNHVYIYSSDGIPVMLVGGINFDDIANRPKYDGQPMTSDTNIPDLTDEIATIEAKIQAMVTDFSYKGSVADYAHLPNDATTGDVYTTLDTGLIYVWDGSQWVALNRYPSVFTGTDGEVAGTDGLVPAPAIADVGKVLGADGTWVTSGPNVVQTTGTSTTDVMSQNAATKLVYGNPPSLGHIVIGDGATYNTGQFNSHSITIGKNATDNSANGRSTTIGDSASSAYQGVALGDTATAGGSATALGYEAEAVTNCTAVGWGAKAKGAFAYSTSVGYNSLANDGYSVAVGAHANATGQRSIAIGGCNYDNNPAKATASRSIAFTEGTVSGSYSIGFGADVAQSGVMNIETNGNNGYSSTTYRLLTGLYDPQNAHDAATKGYVDTAVGGAVATINSTDWSNLWQ